MDQNVRPDFYEGQYLGAEDLDGVVDYDRVQRARHGLGAHTWGHWRRSGTARAQAAVWRRRGIDSAGSGVGWLLSHDRRFGTRRVTTDKFANFQADTPPDGLLIKVWLRYAEKAGRPTGAGLRGVPARWPVLAGRRDLRYRGRRAARTGPHGSVNVAGLTVDARNARAAFLSGAPDLFDESVPYQTFPPAGNRRSGGPGRLRALAEAAGAAGPTDRAQRQGRRGSRPTPI